MKSQLDTNRSERCSNEKDFLAARAAVADWWADDGDVIDARYDRALTNQQLRIQRFPFSFDEQYSGRPHDSRFSEHDGKQSRPRSSFRGSPAATVVVPG